MASESSSQPSQSPIMNSSDCSTIPCQIKRRNLFKRIFGNLHATPFIYTDELKQYSVNGCHVNNKRRTVITKK
jgi:hypothetical protein